MNPPKVRRARSAAVAVAGVLAASLGVVSGAVALSAPSAAADPATHTGRATFYYSNGLAGACGLVSPDSSLVAAVSTDVFGRGYPNPNCGRHLDVHYGNRTVRVTIVDECVPCSPYDLDLSAGAFTALAPKRLGAINVTWSRVAEPTPTVPSKPKP